MQFPMMNNNNRGDESKLSQTRYWINIGGAGISPEMLTLTGFWSEETLKTLKGKGLDTTQSLEQIYGGTVRFNPLPGKNFMTKLTEVIDALNMILQVKRHINDLIQSIPDMLATQWGIKKDSPYLQNLPEDLKKMLSEEGVLRENTKYVVAGEKNTAGQLLQVIPLLEGVQKRIGYFPYIYREANTMFHLMVMETVRRSMDNLSEKTIPQPQYVELEALADQATDAIIEG